MISFARGLVLRNGIRTLEFERDLGGGKVQFKFLDTFEVCTFEVAKIYKEILSGKIGVIKDQAEQSHSNVEESIALRLPSMMNPVQDALIAFRMQYIKAVLRARVSQGSARQLAVVIAKVSNSDIAVTDEEQKLTSLMKVPSPSTLIGWLKRYRQSGGNPFVLCDLRPLARKPKRLTMAIEAVVEEAIGKYFLKPRGMSVRETHLQVREEIKNLNRRNESNLIPPSERTVSRRINEIPNYIKDFKRFGPDFARNKWRYSLAGDQSTRILERVEIDHTLLDIWVLDPVSGVPLGRPWITVVMDRFSGYILGLYISFYGPSSGTVAKALKCTIMPKGDLIAGISEIKHGWSAMGVPELIIVDNGMEFHAAAFRRIVWNLRCDLIYNPVRQPWLKASIERVMMEFNRVLPNCGKVFAPIKNELRRDPEKSAAILFDDLCTCLLIWAAQVHPNRTHPKTLVRPIDLWEDGRRSSPPALLPTDLSHLELAAGISTERTIGGDGVFFKYLRYNSVQLQDYRRSHGQTFRTEVRFNPDDLGFMHVHLPKAQQWIQVELQRPCLEYGTGLSLLQHELARKEAGAKLTRVNADEVLLVAQESLKDRWNSAIQRGLKVRKNADLIRAKGLSSANAGSARGTTGGVNQQVPEPSSKMADNLSKVMPFKSYSMDEEEYV